MSSGNMPNARTADTPQRKEFRILVHCGNGYAFGEYVQPMLEDLADCRRHLLMTEYRVTDVTRASLARLISSDEKFTCEFVPQSDGVSGWRYHQFLAKLLRRLDAQDFQAVVLNTDFMPIDRYLIDWARARKIPVVIAQANILDPVLLRRYLSSAHPQVLGLAVKNPAPAVKPPLAERFQRLIKIERRRWRNLWGFYLWPLLVRGRIFPTSRHDVFHFTCGRGDVVLCYDRWEAEALRQAFPLMRRVIQVRQPVSRYAGRTKVQPRLLILLSCYDREMPSAQFDFWIALLRRVVLDSGLRRMDVRFHPRTSEHLVWPQRFLDALKGFGEVRVLDSSTVSLVDIAGDYTGVVGAVSGSLRTVRALSSGFVLGLLNASGEVGEQAWMLGESQGIHWLKCPEDLRPGMLGPNSPVPENVPSAGDVVRRVLKGEAV